MLLLISLWLLNLKLKNLIFALLGSSKLPSQIKEKNVKKNLR